MGIYVPFAFQNAAVGGFPVSDADAQAYIDKVVAVGGTMTQSIANAVNTLFTGLKADGLYTQTKALYPMVGATPASHALNAKSVNDADTTVTWLGRMNTAAGHSSAGCLPNATSLCYGQIARTPTELFNSATDYSMGVYQSSFTANSGFMIGPLNAATFTNPRFQLNIPLDGTNNYLGMGGPNFIGPISSTPTGFFFGSRSSATSLTFYKNGSSIGTNATSVSNIQNQDIQFFGANGSANMVIGTVSFIILADGFDGTESSNLNTRIQTFQTSLSRNV
jgi:hypothetical protein